MKKIFESYKSGRNNEIARPTTRRARLARGLGKIVGNAHDAAAEVSQISYDAEMSRRVANAQELAAGYNLDLLDAISNLASTKLYPGVNAPAGMGTKRDMRGNIKSERDTWNLQLSTTGRGLGGKSKVPVFMGVKFLGQNYNSVLVSVTHDGMQKPVSEQSVSGRMLFHNGDLNHGASSTVVDIAADGAVTLRGRDPRGNELDQVQSAVSLILHDSEPAVQVNLAEAIQESKQ